MMNEEKSKAEGKRVSEVGSGPTASLFSEPSSSFILHPSSLPFSLLPSPFSLSSVSRHFARFMEKLSGGENPLLYETAALVSEAVQDGHVCIDLAELAGQPITSDKPSDRWPELEPWTATLGSLPVVGKPGDYRPLVLSGSRLYLYRYWNYEQRLAAMLQERCTGIANDFNLPRAREAIAELFPAGRADVKQKSAAAIALLKRFSLISGGPGTGKTSTVLRIAALLATVYHEKKLRIALCAPTGKAAARLEESISAGIASLGCPAEIAAAIPNSAETIHSLLRPLPDSPYFRHNAGNLLPFDVVIVDEASMVDCALMTKLLDAVAPMARFILIGDKDQLASVEAGSLLADMAGPAEGCYSEQMTGTIGQLIPDYDRPSGQVPPIADAIVTLTTNYRFARGSGIGGVSAAVNSGDADRVLSLLESGSFADCTFWTPPSYKAVLERLEALTAEGLRISADPAEALAWLAAFRVLCAVRNGPFGVNAMNERIEFALDGRGLIDNRELHYSGRPVMITANDYHTGLFNGDTGVVLPDGTDHGSLKAFFPNGHGAPRSVSLARLPVHETAFAMTVHKAQGSEFDRGILILPPVASPVVTRELLYTGITRCRKQCEIWCTEEVLRRAVGTRIKRTSGLREKLL